MISFKKYLLEDDSGESNNHEHKTEEERKLLIPIHQNGNSNNQNPPIVFANVSNIFIKEQKLGYLWFICITYFIFAVFEVVGGFYSNSIAIMSDAAHSFSDSFRRKPPHSWRNRWCRNTAQTRRSGCRCRTRYPSARRRPA